MTQLITTIIDPASTDGNELAQIINQNTLSYLSNHIGVLRPTYAVPGTIWIDNNNPALAKMFLYTGVVDILLQVIDVNAGTTITAAGITTVDSSASLVPLSLAVDDIAYAKDTGYFYSVQASSEGYGSIQIANGNWAIENHKAKLTNLTLSVGSGGDFNTLSAALAYLSIIGTQYALQSSVVINLLSGFVLSEQIVVSGVDLGWVKLVAADGSVPCVTAAATVFPSASSDTQIALMYAISGGVFPEIACKFIGDDPAALVSGLSLEGAGSSVYFDPGDEASRTSGIREFNNNIVVREGSTATGRWCDFSSAGKDGAVVSRGAHGSFDDSNLGSAVHRCLYLTRGGSVVAHNALFDNCGVEGIRVEAGSSLNLRGSVISGFSSSGIIMDGGTLYAYDVDLNGSAGIQLELHNGAQAYWSLGNIRWNTGLGCVYVGGAGTSLMMWKPYIYTTSSTCQYGILCDGGTAYVVEGIVEAGSIAALYAAYGGSINAGDGGSARAAGAAHSNYGCLAAYGGKITVDGLDLRYSGYALRATDGGDIHAKGATLTNNANGVAMDSILGSRIALTDCVIGSDQLVFVDQGSFISIGDGCTGGQGNQGYNLLTPNGVIFRG